MARKVYVDCIVREDKEGNKRPLMVGFFIGLFVGGFFGVAIMSCLNVASAADDRMEEQDVRDIQMAEIVDCEFDSEDKKENDDENT